MYERHIHPYQYIYPYQQTSILHQTYINLTHQDMEIKFYLTCFLVHFAGVVHSNPAP